MSGAARIERDEASPDFNLGERLTAAGGDVSAAVFSAKGVSPTVTEATRVRCAQIHDCRLCGSTRLKDALDLGFDEEMHVKVFQYESSDLDAPTVAALRLTDAIILDPGSADAALADELRLHFSDEQIAEICLDVLNWSEQKHLVALRLEEPPWQEPNIISFDDEGGHEMHGPVSAAS